MDRIRIAIIGVGNCASSLIQGLSYYNERPAEDMAGIMHPEIGGYSPADIEVVAAFDIDKRKVGRSLSEAVFAAPNNTRVFCPQLRLNGPEVLPGRILDGVSPHFKNYPEDEAIIPGEYEEPTQDQIVAQLRSSGAEILVNYLPVGSEQAARFYAECALEAGTALVNCIPVFIASDPKWASRFAQRGLPIVGDDIKAQIGATILHRTLAELCENRGVQIDRTYQLNVGSNTDFLNMLSHDRLQSKRRSKTEAVQSVLRQRLDSGDIHVGPSDYVSWLHDNKIAFLRIEGRGFGGVPMNLEVRLSVEDSPNSAGVAIDAIRCCKLALDRKIAGPVIAASAYLMKRPPEQFPDHRARLMMEEFISAREQTKDSM